MDLLPTVDTGTHRRVALLADVHGNRWALAAVLAEIAGLEVDAVYSLGCLTWGPQPRAVLALLTEQGRRVDCLAGNGGPRGRAEATVVHGHTHLQYQREVAGRRIAGCGSVGLPHSADGPAAYWTLLDGDGVHPRRTGYGIDAAAADVLTGDYPGARRYAAQLTQPLDPEEITADAEAREFSD